MKNLLKLFAVALMFGFVMISCEESRDEMPSSGSIYELASRDTDLSNLKAAIDKAGLATTLQSSGTFTVFAPSNAAFATFLKDNGFANLEAVPVATLREILLNHVPSFKVIAADVTTGYVSMLAKGSASSSRNISMYINTSSGVRINGVSTVTATNISADNGVIHKVDKVIGLPTVVTQKCNAECHKL
ncbi:fasciclin domain-containing protein [Chryseobacterium sp. 6424]|uniref:fasciclin domain-containing protein n=1 Tax=Chryseobacterium sp. 6424 TaxID=2039166 RepID=UPI001E28FECE|nr:fasciclin domain-containing protein [Chryseobacterium sp. 6424]